MSVKIMRLFGIDLHARPVVAQLVAAPRSMLWPGRSAASLSMSYAAPVKPRYIEHEAGVHDVAAVAALGARDQLEQRGEHALAARSSCARAVPRQNSCTMVPSTKVQSRTLSTGEAP